MSAPAHLRHREEAPPSIACGVITVSDTRTEATDKSGQLIQQLLRDAGHQTQAYHIIKDEPSQIRPLLKRLLARSDLRLSSSTVERVWPAGMSRSTW